MTVIPAGPAPAGTMDRTRPRTSESARLAFEPSELEVSIVMPCLNEEEAVGACVQKALYWLNHYGYRGEVVVVDNGWSDRSAEFAAAAGARVVPEVRRGYGRAYLSGFAQARGRYLIMGDADDTYDFQSIRDLLQPLIDGSHDLVIGSRLRGGIADGAMPWAHRYIGTPAINALMGLFTGVRVSDSQSGMRAFTRAAYDRMGMQAEGMEFASEMVVRSSRNNLRITETPIPYNPRLGESKLRTFRDGWRHLRYLLLSAPNVVFIMPGVTLVLLGIVTSLLTLISPGGFAVGSYTWQPVFASTIFLVVGSTALALGVLSKRHGAARGIVPRDRWVDFYERYLNLELLLVLAGAMLLVGAALDTLLFVTWVADAELQRSLQLAALAQSFLIVGANLGLVGFLAVILDQPQTDGMPSVPAA